MKYKLFIGFILIAIGCTKKQKVDKCFDLLEFSCLVNNDSASSLVGTYGSEDICVYSNVGSYMARTLVGSYSTSDPNGENHKAGYYNGVIHLSPNEVSHTLPAFSIRTPLLDFDPEGKLSYFEQMNERIQFFNSKELWKVGYDLDNTNEEYLSLTIDFNCDELDPEQITYGIHFRTENEQLGSEDFIRIEQFDLEEIDEFNFYHITFDINISLYKANCFQDCKRDKLNAKWKSSFSIPII